MIVLFDKKTLLEALTPAMYTVSGKNTMPAIEGVHLVCSSDDVCKYNLFKTSSSFSFIYILSI